MTVSKHQFDSTNVRSAQYDSDLRVLYVTFKERRKYRYSRIPPRVWTDFTKASSPGRYVHDTLAQFPYREV